MARQRINDIELYYELTGEGDDAVVLVHGSWTDHLSWQLVAPALAERHRVLTYDRRGHSRSERPTAPSSRRLDEDDLAGLIEFLDLGAVHLVGNSYGGSIALGLAARRPDLVCSVAAHEPPLLGVAEAHLPLAVELTKVHSIISEVSDMLLAGNLEQGAQLFVEEVALGTGMWPLLPDENRRTFVANAATFLATLDDPHWADVPRHSDRQTLLTDGDASPPWFPAIVEALASTEFLHARRHTFSGGGHVPHLTHPDVYTAALESFLSAATPEDRSANSNDAPSISHREVGTHAFRVSSPLGRLDGKEQ